MTPRELMLALLLAMPDLQIESSTGNLFLFRLETGQDAGKYIVSWLDPAPCKRCGSSSSSLQATEEFFPKLEDAVDCFLEARARLAVTAP